jgi:hypothetical protein
MSARHRDEQLHLKAVELVRAAYDVVDAMRRVDLAAINEVRPPTLRYRAQYELVREFIVRANTMLDFAGQLGLIESDEDGEIRRSVGRDHPDLDQWLEDEDKRLLAES